MGKRLSTIEQHLFIKKASLNLGPSHFLHVASIIIIHSRFLLLSFWRATLPYSSRIAIYSQNFADQNPSSEALPSSLVYEKIGPSHKVLQQVINRARNRVEMLEGDIPISDLYEIFSRKGRDLVHQLEAAIARGEERDHAWEKRRAAFQFMAPEKRSPRETLEGIDDLCNDLDIRGITKYTRQEIWANGASAISVTWASSEERAFLVSEAFKPRQIRDGEEALHFSEIWFQLWKAEAGAELKNLKFGCSIEINNESTVRILKEAYKRCHFTDGVRAIDPAAGADQEQAFLALSGSVSGSTFYRMLQDHPIEFNGTKVLRVHACSIAREESALFWEFGR